MHIISDTKMPSMTDLEKLKDAIKLHHVLILINIILFVVIAFITWDILWWWNIGDWDEFERIMFLFLLLISNGVACGAYYDIKKD